MRTERARSLSFQKSGAAVRDWSAAIRSRRPGRSKIAPEEVEPLLEIAELKDKFKPLIAKKPGREGPGGYHGIIFVPDILERTPAYIEDIVPGSPAEKAGLRADDLVSFVDGEPIISIKAFNQLIKKTTRPGTKLRLEVRRGESLTTVEIELGAHPAKAGAPTPPAPPTPAPTPKP